MVSLRTIPKKYKRSSLLTSQQIIARGVPRPSQCWPPRNTAAPADGFPFLDIAAEEAADPTKLHTLLLQQKSIGPPQALSALAPDANAALHLNPVPELQALMKKAHAK